MEHCDRYTVLGVGTDLFYARMLDAKRIGFVKGECGCVVQVMREAWASE